MDADDFEIALATLNNNIEMLHVRIRHQDRIIAFAKISAMLVGAAAAVYAIVKCGNQLMITDSTDPTPTEN